MKQIHEVENVLFFSFFSFKPLEDTSAFQTSSEFPWNEKVDVYGTSQCTKQYYQLHCFSAGVEERPNFICFAQFTCIFTSC